MSSNGAGPSRGMSAHPKLWKPLGGRGAFPAPLNTTTGSVRTAFPGPASGSTLADTAIARLLPGIRSVNSFVRDILSAEDSAPDKERGRRGRAGSRSTAARRSSLGVRAHASAEADLLTPTSASTSTLAEGDGNLYDSFRSSFPHLMSLAEQGGPLSRGTLDRRSKSLPRRTSAAATPVSRYGEDEENVALSDETRAKVARPTQAISNVCRILTDLLELREEACANADELDERKVGCQMDEARHGPVLMSACCCRGNFRRIFFTSSTNLTRKRKALPRGRFICNGSLSMFSMSLIKWFGTVRIPSDPCVVNRS